MVAQAIPDPALVVLIGPSGSGKSSWAHEHYRPEEVVSSDRLRAIVGSGEHDLDASSAAFSLLDQIVEARLARRLNTVVDTLGFDDERRRRHRDLARAAGLPAVAVVFAESPDVCRARNRTRTRPVPAAALTGQFRRFRQLDLESDGWDLVVRAEPSRITVLAPETVAPPEPSSSRGRFYLQLSRFPSNIPLGPWLGEMATAAENTGFAGIAVMDHLIQIPQVGREWEPMPEAYTTLSFLAGISHRLELGCLVTGVRLRSPALLAKIIATLDVVSGGRAFCGLGAGWFQKELDAFGYSTGERFAQLEDTIQILRRMWAPGKATYQGRLHSVTEATSYPRPLHDVPIILGGNGLRTRRLAFALADGVNLVGMKAEQLLPELKEQIKAAGRGEDFSVSILDTPLLGSSRDEVARRVEQWRGSRPASSFARAHRAAMAIDHVATYRRLIAAGCPTFFLAPVGLEDPSGIFAWEPVLAEVG